MSNVTHDLPFRHADGKTTHYFLQEITRTGATPTYILHEHPANAHSSAPSVRDISGRVADALIEFHRQHPAPVGQSGPSQMAGASRAFMPEDLQLYVERRTTELDTKTFQKVEVRTTQVENQRVGEHGFQQVPTRWLHNEPHDRKYTRGELETQIGAPVLKSEYALRQSHGLEGVSGPQIDRDAERQRIQQQ